MLDNALVMFESSVISYGSQTILVNSQFIIVFESSVISYGSQTQTLEIYHLTFV